VTRSRAVAACSRRLPLRAPEEALGRPGGGDDRAAAAADARQLARGLLVVRGEHVPERRQDAVEAAVGEREPFGVALHPLDRQPVGLRLRAPLLEQLGDQVKSGHAGAGSRRGTRGVAGTAGDVEHLHARADADRSTTSSPTSAMYGDSAA
jgi:hypothetical protein